MDVGPRLTKGRLRGEVLLRSQPPDLLGAETALQLALEVARQQQAKTFALRAALSLARLYQDDRPRSGRRNTVSLDRDRFQRTPSLPEVEQANKLLTGLNKPAC